jgi:hypothetical protein
MNKLGVPSLDAIIKGFHSSQQPTATVKPEVLPEVPASLGVPGLPRVHHNQGWQAISCQHTIQTNCIMHAQQAPQIYTN